jgi:tetratricopeptide (TPR) repeat protein
MRFIVVLLLLVATAGFAQKKKKDKDKEPPATAPTQQQSVSAPATQTQPQQPPADTIPTAGDILTDHFLRKYSAAARWSDPDVAKDALYDVIVENPGSDSLIYTLAYLYYDQQKYASSFLIANDLLQRQPKDPSYLEMAAVSAQQLGANEKALQNYETLYLVNNNIRTLYQVAFLQYNMKRYAECTTNITIMLGKPEATTEKVMFNDAQGKEKEYLLKVSVLNLQGLVALDQNDKAAAKKAFTEALALAPDFKPAKDNLEKTK